MRFFRKRAPLPEPVAEVEPEAPEEEYPNVDPDTGRRWRSDGWRIRWEPQVPGHYTAQHSFADMTPEALGRMSEHGQAERTAREGFEPLSLFEFVPGEGESSWTNDLHGLDPQPIPKVKKKRKKPKT